MHLMWWHWCFGVIIIVDSQYFPLYIVNNIFQSTNMHKQSDGDSNAETKHSQPITFEELLDSNAVHHIGYLLSCGGLKSNLCVCVCSCLYFRMLAFCFGLSFPYTIVIFMAQKPKSKSKWNVCCKYNTFVFYAAALPHCLSFAFWFGSRSHRFHNFNFEWAEMFYSPNT